MHLELNESEFTVSAGEMTVGLLPKERLIMEEKRSGSRMFFRDKLRYFKDWIF